MAKISFLNTILNIFCVGVDGPLKKERPERHSREKSPGVSFAEAEEVFDFEDRQYQTVHAGIPVQRSSIKKYRVLEGIVGYS